MTKYCWVILSLFVATACNDAKTRSCTVTCATNSDCPSGLTCGELGVCSDGGACACTAGDFITCSGDNAVYCNTTANGVSSTSCESRGCNADMAGCNACIANTISCSADLTTLDHCSNDGAIAQRDACPAGCVRGSGGAADRCGYIQPKWLPDVCSTSSTAPSASLAGTLDVQQDTACTGGVITANGTTFCVVRAGKVTVADLKVTGYRALAIVADDDLTVSGTLDVSADGATPGPGAGTRGNGASAINSTYMGAGGAGFAQTGGAGGNTGTTPTGPLGGAITDRLTTDSFVGGASGGVSQCGDGSFACFNSVDFAGGGGGGGAMLIACRGTLSVTGTIDAGGGGGTGGGDHDTTSSVSYGGGAGGGGGGYVALQAPRIEITGKTYANGGGGGGGCTGNNCTGPAGADGPRSTTSAAGGFANLAGSDCTGGDGGSTSHAPTNGFFTYSTTAAGAGGGGGSMGRFDLFTPAGAQIVLTPAEASPAPTQNAANLGIN